MNEQPEALRLAERLVGMEASSNDQYQAAAELRRLHAENTEIRTLNDDLFYQGLAVINEKQELLDAAVKAEREACAKACEKMADNIYSNSHEDSQPMPHAVAKFCAAAIRARGEV
jgi:DNA-binding ferritin-like protein